MNTSNNSGFRELPALENQKCFACSPVNPTGLKMRFHADAGRLVSWVTVPEHMCGWRHLAHGGVIAAILDEVMSWGAIYLLKRVILTRSMAIEFKKPVPIGKSLRAEGSVYEVRGPREAVMEGRLYRADDDVLCARAEGVFALLSPEAAMRLSVVDAQMLADLKPLLGTSPG
ncbi:hypothetical protein D3OALGA1CA_4835 [Olavius algarvensis associated proteobacterium Delta 3]|nr:hypothetical protein D3OALGB2SA_689 [Olavius algarvensis associated proteobacterium Delta 3]CAB5157649.1 hypothetical protein D3OALGA1CA_4835 [Olavius algarvensis associated proteobacterium Delta 3]